MFAVDRAKRGVCGMALEVAEMGFGMGTEFTSEVGMCREGEGAKGTNDYS